MSTLFLSSVSTNKCLDATEVMARPKTRRTIFLVSIALAIGCYWWSMTSSLISNSGNII